LDFGLLMKITQTVQAGQGGKSFVDVLQLLREAYGHLPTFPKHLRKGKLTAQYERAVAVLDAGGIARRVTKRHRTKDGALRDVFELLPDNVLNKIGPPVPRLPGL
jgi:hypothetical protein